ncbi:MAG: hypothetical protein EPO23_03325 [Xanthobacteraceae bacterium]|nr:MAG: hypothetical protein EPO23_03325 [Xanthobacteraceae bacterium]
MTMLAVDGRSLKIGDYVEPVERMPARAAVPMPRCWFLLRLHPNREFAVARGFAREGLAGYLPVYPKQLPARPPHRPKPMLQSVPLFPGLIFVPDFEARLDRLKVVEGVVGFVHFGEQWAALSPAMLAAVRALEAELAVPRAERAKRLALGTQVRMSAGPFEGWTGRIARLDSRGRLRVLLEAVKREIPLEVGEDQVEAVS